MLSMPTCTTLARLVQVRPACVAVPVEPEIKPGLEAIKLFAAWISKLPQPVALSRPAVAAY